MEPVVIHSMRNGRLTTDRLTIECRSTGWGPGLEGIVVSVHHGPIGRGLYLDVEGAQKAAIALTRAIAELGGSFESGAALADQAAVDEAAVERLISRLSGASSEASERAYIENALREAEKRGRVAGLREAADLLSKRIQFWKSNPVPPSFVARGEAEASLHVIQKRAEEAEQS